MIMGIGLAILWLVARWRCVIETYGTYDESVVKVNGRPECKEGQSEIDQAVECTDEFSLEQVSTCSRKLKSRKAPGVCV